MEINVINFLDLKYIISLVLGSYGILSFVIKTPSSTQKHIFTFSWGVALAIVWYYALHITLDTLIVSFIISVVGYDKLLAPILKQLNISYDDHNGKGII